MLSRLIQLLSNNSFRVCKCVCVCALCTFVLIKTKQKNKKIISFLAPFARLFVTVFNWEVLCKRIIFNNFALNLTNISKNKKQVCFICYEQL